MNSALRPPRPRNVVSVAFIVVALMVSMASAIGAQSVSQNATAPGVPAVTTDCSAHALKAKGLPLFALSSTSRPAPAAEDSTGELTPSVMVARGDEITFALSEGGNAAALSQPVRDLLECLRTRGESPRLVLNGVQLGAGARLINTQDWSNGKVTFFLPTRLPSTASAKDVGTVTDYWTSAYRKAGWGGASEQYAELQFDSVGIIASTRGKDNVLVYGSSSSRLKVAAATAIVIVILFAWALVSNEVFRDKAPAWIENARALSNLYQSSNLWQQWLVGQAALLGITGAQLTQHAAITFQRLKNDRSVPSEQDSQLAAIGALISNQGVPQVSYSLSRVQVGAWLVATIIGGLVIWIVQGELPTIPDTYLALLGISAGTKVLSGLIDNAKEHSIGGIHRSFFADLTAGTNGGGVHRYQALLINVMLLATVMFELLRNVAFPEINGTWLILLTGSAGVYLTAKQIDENPSAPNPGNPAPVGGPIGNPPPAGGPPAAGNGGNPPPGGPLPVTPDGYAG